MTQLRRALALDASDPDAAADLAVQLYLAGDYNGALPLLATALARRPDDPVLLSDLGLVRAMRGEWAAAAASFSASLERRPDSADTLIGLGAAEIELSRPAAADDIAPRARTATGRRTRLVYTSAGRSLPAGTAPARRRPGAGLWRWIPTSPSPPRRWRRNPQPPGPGCRGGAATEVSATRH